MTDTHCLELNISKDMNMTLLFGRVLPYLVQGLLFGGVPPYILHITDLKRLEETKNHNHALPKRVTWDCNHWSDESFTYPSHVTDVIVFSQCRNGSLTMLDQIYRKLSENPSPLARPNLVVVSQTPADFSSSWKKYTKLVKAVILFDILKVHSDTSVHLRTRYIVQNQILPEQLKIIKPEDSLKPFLAKDDFSLDFHGEVLQVLTTSYAPFSRRRGKNANGTHIYEGYAISVLALLAERYNFRYEISRRSVFGTLENGTWIGIIGRVHRQKADMVVTGLTITFERMTAVDFTYPFWFEPVAAAMMIRHQKLFYLFKPFSTTTWLVMLGVFVLVTVCYCIMDSLATRGMSQGRFMDNTDIAAWYSVQIWLIQSGTGQPEYGSLRFASGIMAVCVVVVCATYSGNLIASLTVQKAELPLTSLDELSKSTEYYPMVEYGTVHHGLLESSTSGVYARLWERIKSNYKESMCEQFCTERFLRNEHLVHIGDKTGIEKGIIPKSDCQAATIPEFFYPSGFGIAMPLGTPYKPFFDHTIKLMAESGVLKLLEKRYPAIDNTCAEKRNEKNNAHPLAIYEVGAMFVILGAGVGTSICVFVLELIMKRSRRKLYKFYNYVLNLWK